MAYEEMKAQKKSSSGTAKNMLSSALDSLTKNSTKKSTTSKSRNSTKKSTTKSSGAKKTTTARKSANTTSKNHDTQSSNKNTASSLTMILALIFLAIGVIGGFFTTKFLCKNDVYEMVAYSNGEVDITIGEDVLSYTELGIKCVAFGKDCSNNYKVDYYYRNSMTEDEILVSEVGEKGAGLYYAVYTAPTLKYKTVKLIRNITLLRGEDDE